MSLEFWGKVWLKGKNEARGCQNIWKVFKITRQDGIIKGEVIDKEEDMD